MSQNYFSNTIPFHKLIFPWLEKLIN